MGFGILFIGYIITYLFWMIGSYGSYFAIIGCFIMLYALTKTAEYEPKFKYAFFSLIPLMVCWGFFALKDAVDAFGTILPGFLASGTADTVVTYIRVVAELIYHFALLSSIAKIAGDTGVLKTRNAAWRNFAIYGVFVLTEILDTALPDNTYLALYVFMAVVILWLLSLVLNGICIFSCYMRICDENDTEMEAKQSRFEFINKFRAEYDRREKKAQKENREHHMQKIHKRIDRMNKANEAIAKKKKK